MAPGCCTTLLKTATNFRLCTYVTPILITEVLRLVAYVQQFQITLTVKVIHKAILIRLVLQCISILMSHLLAIRLLLPYKAVELV